MAKAVTRPNAVSAAPNAALEAGWPGDGICAYHTEQPAPAQWIAVGQGNRPAAAGGQWHRLVIGTGTTEAAAIEDMRQRCQLRSVGYQWHTAGETEA